MLQMLAWIWWVQCLIQIRADYLFSEVDRNLEKETEIKFTIHVKESDGVLLYGADVRNNYLLIKILSGSNRNKELTINFNRRQIKDNIENICKCSKCFEKNLYFEIAILNESSSNELIHVKCNGKISKLEIHQKKSAQLVGYPKTEKTTDNENKTFIWIGNIGPYVPLMNKSYHYYKDQINGCLMDFYFNNRSLIFETIGTRILSFCLINYSETVYNIAQCTNKSRSACLIAEPNRNRISRVRNDCKSWIVNDSYCKRDLPPYSNQNQSFRIIGSQPHSFTIRLAWKPFFNKIYSLIQILLNDQSNILLYQNNDSVFYIHNDQSLQLMRFSRDSIKHLLWNFTSNRFTLHINNGDQILTFNGYSGSNVRGVNIGFSVQNRISGIFVGVLEARFDPREIFELASNDSVELGKIILGKIDQRLLLLLISILPICLIVIFIFLIYKKYKTNFKNFRVIVKLAREDKDEVDDGIEYFEIKDNDDYGLICDKKIVF